MRYIEDAVNNPNFGIISISIDPTNDTPEVLKNHAAMMGLNLQTGIFFTGDRDYIGKIADQFNIYVGIKKMKPKALITVV